MSDSQIGVTGLAVMGANLARNAAHKGFRVAVHNRTTAKTEEFFQQHGQEGAITPSTSIETFVAALARPRAIMIMVKAGVPVDAVIEELRPHLEKGDLLIDGGNSYFEDTRRRTRELAQHGLLFLGAGVSGGEEGALEGPSMMPGGSPEAYARVEEIFTRMAAQVDGTPCCVYIGADGAGHYVKMVHNGIEYADMQLIAEAYDLLHTGLGMDNDELAETFATWNKGDLDSFLIEITATIFRKRDEGTGQYLVDLVLDEAAQKGTGKWTSQLALDLGVPATTITEAVFARGLSALKAERVVAAKALPGPTGRVVAPGDRARFVNDVRDALYGAKVVAYAQGFQQLAAAATEYKWDLHMGELATIWRGGCIIRAKFLDRIRDAYASQGDLRNLLLAPYFRDAVAVSQDGWRRTVAAAVATGIPVPAFSSALAYYDGYRRDRLPANLIQAQRDLFGAHTYRRTDRPGDFHSQWS